MRCSTTHTLGEPRNVVHATQIIEKTVLCKLANCKALMDFPLLFVFVLWGGCLYHATPADYYGK